MKSARIIAGAGIIVVVLIATVVYYYQHSNTRLGATGPALAGTAIAAGTNTSQAAAAISPTPSPTVPPPPRPAPTTGNRDPDLTHASVGPGAPAIKPHLTPGPATSSFTADDVRDYIATAGIGPGRARMGGPYELASIVFMTSGEAKNQLGIATGQPDATLLCIATLRGTFTVVGPAPPNGGTAVPHVLHTFTLVFDAHTGNLLIQSGAP